MIFSAPFLLFFLLIVPSIIWLIRATPPKPRTQHFSSLLLLQRLHPRRQDAAHTPLWLLLLRASAVILAIFAFSRPVWLTHNTQSPPSHLLIVLDNGWASIPHWEERRRSAQNLGEKTLRVGGHVTLLLSARNADGRWPEPFSPRSIGALTQHLRHLKPHPWPVERQTLSDQLTHTDLRNTLSHAHIVILSDGLAEQGDKALHTTLATSQNIRDVRWPTCDLVRLSNHPSPHHFLSLMAETLPNCPQRSLSLNGLSLNKNGDFNTLAHWSLHSGELTSITPPNALVNVLDAVNIPSIPAPAGIFLLAGGQHQYSIGLLQLGGDNTPLTGAAFYLSHAIDKSATVQHGDLKTLLKTSPSLMMAPDGTLGDENSLQKILDWVQKGGVLIRFAGSDLAHQDDTSLSEIDKALLPVPLLHGMRQLGGPMSWGSPQKLAPFSDQSPFAGLAIPNDVTISRQVLAQPTNDLQDHVWATLKDGTPLVTARHEGRGLVILFHITPTADWSNLPLSGLFPQMLERLMSNTPILARSTTSLQSSDDALPGWKILSPQGTLVPASSTTHPIQRHHNHVDATHPAGLYGVPPHTEPLNLSDQASPLHPEPALGVIETPNLTTPDWPIWPVLGAISLLFLFIDVFLSFVRQGALPFVRTVTIIGFLITFWSPLSAHAKPTPSSVPPGALEIHLAYILTGDTQTDKISQQGLEGLTRFVNRRSTTHLGAPIGVTPTHDDLAFYPLIYWPVLSTSQTNSAQETALNNYIHHNGLLFIDKMGAGSILDSSNGTAAQHALQRVTAHLDIPPLTPITDEHTLSHAFYLLHEYPGRLAGNPVYVARFDNEDGENVSPIIIGNADWAHAWAIDQNENTPFAVIPDGEQQRTLAYRFGFNAVIYALTGNYKNDQRYYPEILHRLGNATNNAAPDTEEGP